MNRVYSVQSVKSVKSVRIEFFGEGGAGVLANVVEFRESGGKSNIRIYLPLLTKSSCYKTDLPVWIWNAILQGWSASCINRKYESNE